VVQSVADYIAGRIRFAIAEPTEWQCIANQINAAMIFAGANFVKAQGSGCRRSAAKQ